jgi:Flp pilus assembly protein TadG
MRRIRLKNRRGATMVLAACLMVPLLTIAAFALDLSWWQVTTSQLQTAADAAALSGARALQLYPNSASDSVPARASTAAAANLVQGVAGTADTVQPGTWNPTARTFTSSGWSTANAVRVASVSRGGQIFSGVARSQGPDLSRPAIAWVAQINSGTCITPWGLPYTTLYDKAAQLASSGASTASPRPDLTGTQLAALSSPTTTDAQRTIVLYGQNAASTPPTGSGVTAYNGGWIGYGYSGNSGQTAYQSGHWSCNNTVVSVASSGGTTLATAGADVGCWSVRAMMGNPANNCNTSNWDYLTDPGPNPQTCFYKGVTNNGLTGTAKITTYDAGCYPSATETSAGVMLRVTWSDQTGTGSNALSYRVIGRLKLVCLFRGASGAGSIGASGTANTGVTNETCQSGSSTVRNLPIGTIVAQVQGISSDAMTPSTVLGTTPGDVQKLVLVR